MNVLSFTKGKLETDTLILLKMFPRSSRRFALISLSFYFSVVVLLCLIRQIGFFQPDKRKLVHKWGLIAQSLVDLTNSLWRTIMACLFHNGS